MPQVIIGLAFRSHKLTRVLTSELRRLAEIAGLHLLPLDPHTPLEVQEERKGVVEDNTCTVPFDVIVHKLHNDPEWEANLSNYLSLRTHVRLLDPPSAVHMTEDRSLMLSAIPAAGLVLQPEPQRGHGPRPQPPMSKATCSGASSGRVPGCVAAAGISTAGPEAFRVRSPPQALVGSLAELQSLAQGGHQDLRPPLIIKTQRADAAGGSGHGLAVAMTWQELTDRAEALQGSAHAGAGSSGSSAAGGGCGGGWIPLIVQQYVPHSEALYKVYVLGRQIRVVRRTSLTLRQLQALGPNAPSPPSPAKRPRQQPKQLQQQQQKEQQGDEQQQQQQGNGASRSARGSRQVASLLLHNLSSQPQVIADASEGTGECDPLQPPAVAVPVAKEAGGGGSGGEHGAGTSAGGPREAPLLAPTSAPTSAGPLGGTNGASGRAVAPSSQGLDERLLASVARELGRRMGLSLFNFDVVVPEPGSEADGLALVPSGVSRPPEQVVAAGSKGSAEGAPGAGDRVKVAAGEVVLYVVDVNYFPGYDKLPGWEALLVDHFREVADEVMAAKNTDKGEA